MTVRADRTVLLDPFTVVAQVVNFLILLVALKYVLFDRVVEAIDAREREITSRLDSARYRELEAEGRADELDRARQVLEEQRDRLLADVRAEVADLRASMLDDARHELDQRRTHWEHAVQQDHERMLRALDQRVADGVFELVRDALVRLSGEDLEGRVLDVAFERFGADDALVQELARPDPTVPGSVDRIEVSTSFDLGDAGRRLVRERLNTLAPGPDGGPLQIRFRRDPAMVLGVRLRAEAVSVEWSVGDYLDRLRSMVDVAQIDVTRLDAAGHSTDDR